MLGLHLALLFSLTPVEPPQDHVRFIVTGDDRWNTSAPRAGLDENGVNVTGFGRVIKAILTEKPDAFVVNGDLIGGGSTDAEESSQLETWFKVAQPIYDAGIKVLTMRGNHEMHCPDPFGVWRKAMSGAHANPGAGPVGEEGLTYAYTIKNVLFIALDQFKSQEPVVNQTWLDTILKAPHPQHVFAFAHKMAFFSGNHTDGMWDALPQRDTFMKSLKEAGAKTVFFGHDHLYDHLSAKLPDWGDDQAIHQFVIGTAGAPFVKGKTLTTKDHDWTLNRIAHVEKELGYCVVDVDGPKVTIVYKSEKTAGDFVPVDTFTYTLASSH